MTKDARALVLVVGGDVLLLCRAAHGVEDVARPRVFCQAVAAADDPVASACVEAAGYAPAPRVGVWGRGLVAIRDGLALHADDLPQLALVGGDHGAKKVVDLLLLAPQLDGIGNCEPLAAAAVARDRTCVCTVTHGYPLSLCSLFQHTRGLSW